MREAPNLECMVRGINTVDGGSCLLPVLYVRLFMVVDN